jgi:hypothetical protein
VKRCVQFVHFALTLLPIVALLVYDVELLERALRSGHSRTLGFDTIQICYATAAAGLVGATVLAAVRRRSRADRVAARAALALALVATAVFCALHWSGLIVSYDSVHGR